MYKSYFFSSPLMLKVKWTWKLSCVWLFATSGTVVHGILQAGILEWVIFSFFGNLPNPGIEPRSPSLQVDSLPTEPPEKPTYNDQTCLQWSKWSLFFISGIRMIRMRKLLLSSGQEREMLNREVSVRPSTLSSISPFSIVHLSLLRIFSLLFSDTLGL